MTDFERSILDRRELLRRRLAGASIEILASGVDRLRDLSREVSEIGLLIDNLAEVVGQAEAEAGRDR